MCARAHRRQTPLQLGMARRCDVSVGRRWRRWLGASHSLERPVEGLPRPSATIRRQMTNSDDGAQLIRQRGSRSIARLDATRGVASTWPKGGGAIPGGEMTPMPMVTATQSGAACSHAGAPSKALVGPAPPGSLGGGADAAASTWRTDAGRRRVRQCGLRPRRGRAQGGAQRPATMVGEHPGGVPFPWPHRSPLNRRRLRPPLGG